jgi:hypothetical protein
MEIVPSNDDPSNPKPRLFLLHFPKLSADSLALPIDSHASVALLKIGGYQIVRAQHGRDYSPERWTPLKERLQESFQVYQETPLILRLTDISGLLTSPTPGRCDFMLSILLGYRTQEGLYEGHPYDVRFQLTGENGDFPSVDIEHQGDQCPHFGIYPATLPSGKN